MPVKRVGSGGSSLRALRSAQIARSISLEVPVEHGHRIETESLYSFESFSSEVERVFWITDEDITSKNAPVAVACLLEYLSGMFERLQVIRSVISEENLLRFDFPEQFDVPRLENFSLDPACKLWPVLLTFKHVKDSLYMLFRTSNKVE